MSTQSKIAVVTGASSGIGAATALLLAENGFQVIAAARRLDRLQDLASKNSAIEICSLDVTSQSSVDALVQQINSRDIDVLVNNAGGSL
jgi:NADP-dependent 3-hydroxy acid dehydrogenase YdfG